MEAFTGGAAYRCREWFGLIWRLWLGPGAVGGSGGSGGSSQ